MSRLHNHFHFTGSTSVFCRSQKLFSILWSSARQTQRPLPSICNSFFFYYYDCYSFIQLFLFCKYHFQLCKFRCCIFLSRCHLVAGLQVTAYAINEASSAQLCSHQKWRTKQENSGALEALFSIKRGTQSDPESFSFSVYLFFAASRTPSPPYVTKKNNNLMTCNWEEGRSFLIIPTVWECALSHQRQTTFPAPTKRQSFVFFSLPFAFM